MEIDRILVLVNLDLDKNGELRQLMLNKEESQKLIELLKNGYIAEELKVLEKPVETIELKNA